MRIFLLLLILFISILLGSFTTIPVVLDILLVLYIFNRNSWIFFAAFISGLLLDFLLIREVGISSIIFVSFLYLLTLYGRKFEIKTIHFVLFSSFVGTIIYLLILKSNYVLQQAIINSLIAVILFRIFGRIEKKKMLHN